MKILLLAPQPFYQVRGTPIAVDLVLRVLSARGHVVDVLAFHEGVDVRHPNVRIHRIPALPMVRNVGAGPSIKKLICDAFFVRKALRMTSRERYDLVHAVEEAVFLAIWIKRRHGVNYVYDMDSSLPKQIVERYDYLRGLVPWLQWHEGRAVQQAAVVLAACEAVAEHARYHRPQGVVVLNDVSLLSLDENRSEQGDGALRQALNVKGPLVMYVGALEQDRGTGLMLESFASALRRVPNARLVIVGGRSTQIALWRRSAAKLGAAHAVHFLGPRPVSELRRFLSCADVLLSPQTHPINTPMKIYSYMDSGKAILATDLPAHRQVLNDKLAALAEPTPIAFSKKLVQLLSDPALRQRLGCRSRAHACAHYHYDGFRETLDTVYDELERRGNGTPPVRPRRTERFRVAS
jgi:glycosyltransferase involved in cell wall biosynthesis